MKNYIRPPNKICIISISYHSGKAETKIRKHDKVNAPLNAANF
jgi:hypothetical protein